MFMQVVACTFSLIIITLLIKGEFRFRWLVYASQQKGVVMVILQGSHILYNHC